ncbi:snapalysin [Streptomyces griseoluteus]|uniref:Extracellular small neutral protease n=1 Tax=Streptomyces griseoluteus TaxID=29306 RepID=A0A4Z1DA21_STRGP|nr:snapalysin [Streptomyces griseoluteus]GHE97695.1 extracellular small neutral protease [Streptomyces griseoluteus]
MPSSRMPAKSTGMIVALGLGLAAATFGAAAPASARPAPVAAHAGYTGSAQAASDNQAFFDAVLKSVAEKRTENPGLKSVTVTYNPSAAPSFSSQISRAASIWNSSVSNVKLSATSGTGDFSYREGNDSRGSYASTDGHGRGYVFLDYAQNQQYDSVRVVTHETGHVLGLPDHYEGPCSELMSGGGPGPSCTNSSPDANERARVDQLWANGFAKALAKVNQAR